MWKWDLKMFFEIFSEKFSRRFGKFSLPMLMRNLCRYHEVFISVFSEKLCCSFGRQCLRKFVIKLNEKNFLEIRACVLKASGILTDSNSYLIALKCKFKIKLKIFWSLQNSYAIKCAQTPTLNLVTTILLFSRKIFI